ncbi:hypothetical protein C0Z10_08140 [Acidipropionibacterium jensenii]|uniref:Uncharacterized protein n=1 Tax=Acidipropionibacterium jensenii TaxID=1749 RepID=A0A3Q9ULD3_9ACTN|nr:hypothetical protein [Acidipropionibacterium jensenii]AZZ39728.1 hypothetical protein C0Z10_08140 [Acidipropionibacterium jensenii]
MPDGPDPVSWIGRIVGWCFALLVGAMALSAAVQIIESIWWQLCVGGLVALIVAVVIVVLRSRSRF